MMRILNDDQLRRIALLKMDGLSAVDIAKEMGCSNRLVFIKLNLIRQIWKRELYIKPKEASGDCD